jgi:predicted RNA-binding Zn-ribbon protein involved in translation (DUF1610 family)
MGLDTVKCPHCGYMYQMDLAEYKKERETIISKGFFGRSESKLESSKFVDLKCPKCGKEFEWKVE